MLRARPDTVRSSSSFAQPRAGASASASTIERDRSPTAVVATGGNSSYLTGRAQLITHNRPRLTMEGLYALAKKV